MTNDHSTEFVAQHLVDTRTLSLRDTETLNAMYTGELVRIHGEMYYPADLYNELAWYQKRTVHALAVGRRAYTSVLVGRSAARVQGIWTVSTTPDQVEISNPTGAVTSLRDRKPGVKYHGMTLRDDEHIELNGCRVTHPLRTVIDIARLHGYKEGLIACDWALAHGYTRKQLWAALASMGRVRGIRHARRAIRDAMSTSQSAFESYMRALLIEAGYTDLTL